MFKSIATYMGVTSAVNGLKSGNGLDIVLPEKINKAKIESAIDVAAILGIAGISMVSVLNEREIKRRQMVAESRNNNKKAEKKEDKKDKKKTADKEKKLKKEADKAEQRVNEILKNAKKIHSDMSPLGDKVNSTLEQLKKVFKDSVLDTGEKTNEVIDVSVKEVNGTEDSSDGQVASESKEPPVEKVEKKNGIPLVSIRGDRIFIEPDLNDKIGSDNMKLLEKALISVRKGVGLEDAERLHSRMENDGPIPEEMTKEDFKDLVDRLEAPDRVIFFEVLSAQLKADMAADLARRKAAEKAEEEARAIEAAVGKSPNVES